MRPTADGPGLSFLAHILMKSFVLVSALVSFLLLIALTYFLTPDIFAAAAVDGVTVHCELLGEYPSDINRIEIVERANGRMVWRVVAREEMFQLHSFKLFPGLNNSRLQSSSGGAQTDIPTTESFALPRGVSYRASVCLASWLKICRSVDFIF